MCKGKPEFVTRMENELEELNTKIVKARAFLGKEDKGVISDEEIALLQTQVEAMDVYSDCLTKRLKYYHTIYKC